MVRTLTVTLGLALSRWRCAAGIGGFRDSDRPRYGCTGAQVGAMMDDFTVAASPSTSAMRRPGCSSTGSGTSTQQTVFPTGNFTTFVFNTEFSVERVHRDRGLALLRCASAGGRGGNGLDFNIEYTGGQLLFMVAARRRVRPAGTPSSRSRSSSPARMPPTIKSYGLVLAHAGRARHGAGARAGARTGFNRALRIRPGRALRRDPAASQPEDVASAITRKL